MNQLGSTRDIPAILSDLEAAMREARGQLGTDLERLRSVVRDAAAKLDTSFRTLREVMSMHRGLLQTVAGALGAVDQEGMGFAASSDALLRQLVDEIVRVSRESMRIINQLDTLSADVDGIVQCADGIDRLGRETRFIAFNARIETNRAGEAGRTFKVVADEVKRLANASVSLSNSIRDSVGSCRVQLGSLHGTAQGLASHDMSRAVESHKGLADAVTKLDETHRALDSILDKVESSVSMAVQTLQFEDMVSQLVGTSLGRIGTLVELAITGLWTLERVRDGDRAQPLEAITTAMRKLANPGGVQQESMDRGSVELF